MNTVFTQSRTQCSVTVTHTQLLHFPHNCNSSTSSLTPIMLSMHHTSSKLHILQALYCLPETVEGDTFLLCESPPQTPSKHCFSKMELATKPQTLRISWRSLCEKLILLASKASKSNKIHINEHVISSKLTLPLCLVASHHDGLSVPCAPQWSTLHNTEIVSPHLLQIQMSTSTQLYH